MENRWAVGCSLFAVLCLLVASCGASIDAADSRPIVAGKLHAATFSPPSDFRLVNTWTYRVGDRAYPAIRLYQKDYAGGTPDFVTVVDLRYATVINLTGTVSDAPCGILSRQNLGTGAGSFWADATAMNTPTRTASRPCERNILLARLKRTDCIWI
jgi:hypothetical protein